MALLKVLYILLTTNLFKFIISYEVSETLVPRQLYVYKEFKDVQIFKFNVPENTLGAAFNLTSNSSDLCGVRNVTVYLKPHSYPVVDLNPGKVNNYLWMRREVVYNTTFLSNMVPDYMQVDGPVPGDWFMIAFLPDGSNKILQDGLFRRCNTWIQIQAVYTVEPNIPIVSLENADSSGLHLKTFSINQNTYLRYFLPESAWDTAINIPVCYSEDNRSSEDFDCSLILHHRAAALPTPQSTNNLKTECHPSTTCSLQVPIAESGWNYLLVEPTNGSINLQFRLVTSVCSNDATTSATDPISEIPIPTNLTNVQYENITDLFISPNLIDNEDANWEFYEESLLNSTDLSVNATSAPYEFHDSNTTSTPYILPNFGTCWPRYRLARKTFPGNFAFEYDLKLPNGSVPIILKLSNERPTILSLDIAPQTDIGGTVFFEVAVSPFMNTSSNNISVIGCVAHAKPSSIYLDDKRQISCTRGRSLRANSSLMNNFADIAMVPYPEAGRWFLTLFPACFLTNHSEMVSCSLNYTSVIFSVSSSSCMQGKCGPHGSCFQYISGGFIFSTCACKEGFRGWDCSDDSHATPDWKLLVSTLLLTLSNFAFLPVIALAISRCYLTEALVYSFTLFFSVFYHACNQPVYQYCIMPVRVLQFGDFYSAIMSFWVTLIAMAELPAGIVQLVHMIGALMIALGCEYKRTGILVFAVPSTLASIVMVVSWAYHSKCLKQCYPPRNYVLRSLLPGAVLAAVGLVAYSGLQTEENYYLVHSLWHALMAMAVLFVLPSSRQSKAVTSLGVDNSIQEQEAKGSDVEVETLTDNWKV